MSIPFPYNEEARLAAVFGCNILDTEAEEEFNDLTVLASLICQTPIALITILDEHRQWFKSKVGLDVCETPRNISFCAYSICQSDVFIVPDASLDERFANTPLVTGEPHIKFYAGAPLVNDNGTILGTICVIDRQPRELSAVQIKCLQTLARQVVDKIQLRKRTLQLVETNEKLTQNEEQYRFLTEAILQQVWTAAPDGRLTFVNARVLEYFGGEHQSSEFLDDGWMRFVHADDIEPTLNIWQEALTTGKSKENEFRLRRYDGEYRWHLVQVMPIFDESRQLIKWFGTNTDIHEIKIVNENLRQTEGYRNLFQYARDAIIIFDSLSFEIIDVNESACTVYKYDRTDLIGHSLEKILTTPESCRLKVESLLQNGHYPDFENSHRRSDGVLIPFSISASIIEYQGKTAVICINRDMTERLKMEQTLRQSENEMRAIFAAMTDVILVVDKNGYFQKVADTNPNLLYKPAAELIGNHVTTVFSAEQANFFLETVRQTLELKKPVHVEYNLEINEKLTWFSAISSPLNNNEVMWVARDITIQKTSEHALRDSRQMLQFVIDTIPQAVYWKDLNLVFIGCNKYLSDLTGFESPQQIIGKTGRDLSTTNEQAEFSRATDLRVLASGLGEYHISEKVVLANGAEAWLDTNKVPLRDAQGEVIGILGTSENVTYQKKAEAERLQLEAQLQQAQKMESIGTLAGGVAHDFNNLLTVIMSSTELLEAQITKDFAYPPNVLKRLKDIEQAAYRGSSLTRQLLAFSRRQQLERKYINLNDVVAEIIKLLQRLIGADIEIKVNLAPNLPTIYADWSQLDQVIMNLVVNARDAMPDGGKIFIQTQKSEINLGHQSSDGDFSSNQFVQLSVSDTGTGMSEVVQERIFEPFFTTKEVGKGTGLGLAMVYGIIKQHEGHIEVKSEPQRGTTFEIYFPINELVQVSNPPQLNLTAQSGGETVLVAEDEDALRELAREMLELLGYRVILACNGQEAVQLYQKHQTEINLVFLDLVMPEISGNKAYQLIKQTNSAVPVIFTTGYGDRRYIAEFDLEIEQEKNVNVGFLPKPYNLQMLSRKVREVIENSLAASQNNREPTR